MLILDLLKLDNWYGISKEVELAKGLYQIPTSKQQKKQQNNRLDLYNNTNK